MKRGSLLGSAKGKDNSINPIQSEFEATSEGVKVCTTLGSREVYSVMHSDGNSFCGDAVLNSFNKAKYIKANMFEF